MLFAVSFIIYQTYFREYLADANLRVIYAIEESEEDVMRQVGWTRAAYEKKLRDPDDCYVDVVRPEEELRVQGLPSQLGVLFGMRKAEIVGDPLDRDKEGESDRRYSLTSRPDDDERSNDCRRSVIRL
jgi:ribosomal protein S18 acetylase RimI-like enzyme